MSAPGVPGWLVGAGVAAVTLVAAAWRRPRRAVRARLVALSQPAATQTPAVRRNAASRWHRDLVLVAVGGLGFGWLAPPLAVVPGVAVVGWRRWRAVATRRARVDDLRRELPEVVDLLQVAVGSGLNLPLALGAVGERAPPVLGGALRRVAADVERGARLADAIETSLTPLGDPVVPLSSVLLGAARYGTPLRPALDRLAFDARLIRRHQAEEAIRRVPVKLLFPLVLLVLPAFALLTVVPLLAGALRSLHL